MSGDPHFEPGRREVRCDHGDGKGWGHPADPTPGSGWAHACCGVPGHCPQGDPGNLDFLPRGAVGDWEIVTENGTRIVLTSLGGDDPRWWRIPGTPESSRAYSDRPYRLAALRALPDEETWGNEPVTVGMRATIGQGHFSDLWHTSRVVSIRRLDEADPLPLPGFLTTAADKVAERSTWHSLDGVAERLGLDADAMRERAARRQAGETDE